MGSPAPPHKALGTRLQPQCLPPTLASRAPAPQPKSPPGGQAQHLHHPLDGVDGCIQQGAGPWLVTAVVRVAEAEEEEEGRQLWQHPRAALRAVVCGGGGEQGTGTHRELKGAGCCPSKVGGMRPFFGEEILVGSKLLRWVTGSPSTQTLPVMTALMMRPSSSILHASMAWDSPGGDGAAWDAAGSCPSPVVSLFTGGEEQGGVTSCCALGWGTRSTSLRLSPRRAPRGLEVPWSPHLEAGWDSSPKPACPPPHAGTHL